MIKLSFAWGIFAFATTLLAFLPCLSPVNWFNLPFSAIGVILSAVAVARSGSDRPVAAVALICSGLALGVSIIRLLIGASTF